MFLLAQAELADSTVGEFLLENSIEISQATVEAWNKNWGELISTDNGIWAGLSTFGLALAALSLILVSLKMGSDYQQGRFFWSDLAGFIVWPLVITFFLSGNGYILSQTVLLIRGIAHEQVVNVLELELADVTFKRALADITLTNSVRNQIAAIYAECQGKPSEEFNNCLLEKQPVVEEIIARAEEINGGPLEAIGAWAEDTAAFFANPGAGFMASVSAMLVALLQALQWAFVNILEASLLMTATLAPVAVGLSVLPLGSRPIWAWGSGFLGLFTAQLGYNIIVGLAATVIVSAGAQTFSDLGFLAILSIFAPGLALLLGGGGGVALYQGLNNYSIKLATTAFNATAGLTASLIKFFI